MEMRSDVAREVTLSWQAGGDIADVLERSTLVDDETGCEVDPAASSSYTVTMAGPTHRLTWRVADRNRLAVEIEGSGEGRVTSQPEGIDCGQDCSEDYLKDTLVALTPTVAAEGSAFSGWSPSCVDGQATMKFGGRLRCLLRGLSGPPWRWPRTDPATAPSRRTPQASTAAPTAAKAMSSTPPST